MTLLSRNSAFFVSCFAFLLTFQVVYSYSLKGMQLQDLEGTGNDFKADAANWYATIKASTDTWSDCAGTLLVGGYGVLGAATGNSKNSYLWRTYTGLPDHTMIIYTFKMYLLDTWDLSTADGFRYSFDDKAIAGWTADFSMFGPSVCGTSYQDATDIIIFGSAVHSGNSLTFKLISDLDEPPTNEAFGIRDISFTFYQGPVTTTTQCITTSVALSDRKCQCAEGYYYTGSACSPCNGNCQSCYGAGTGNCYACKLASGIGYDGFNCITCHSYCNQCFGTSNTQCTACKAGYSYVAAENTCLEDCPYPMVRAASGTSYTCTSPCTSGQSVYWDQSCGACPAPLVTKVAVYTTTVNLCTYPCSSSEYLYWDGTCQADCEYPLATTVTKGKKFCTYKCASTQFLDWNNNCASSCASPLVQKTVSGSKLCFAPCNKPGDYLYWNNECASACDLPLVQRTTNNVKYCDFRCTTATDYLYWNNTCAATCDAPLKARIEMEKNFCDFPADTNNYLYWDGTQSSTCPSPPLTPYNEGTSPVLKFCGYACDVWEYLYWDGSCALDCLFPFNPRVANGRQFCDYPCTGSDIPLWNGTCVDPSVCVIPLQLNTVATKQVCDFPTGNVSNYLYWDGSFETMCLTPLISRIEGSPMVRKFCDFPCTSPSLPVLNFDGTCISSCSSPSVPRPEYSQQFCDFACGTEFQYYNTSCFATCDTPFVQQISGAGQYCNHPCTTTTDFYYWDGTCNADCSSPLQQYSYNGIDWCLYPCSATQFLTNDGICLDSCDAPFQSSTVSNLKYCTNPCAASEYLFWDGTCLQSCDPPLRSYTSLAGKSCDTPCDTPEEYYQELTGECVKQCDTTTVSVDGLYYKCLANRDDNSTFLDLLLDAPSNQVITLVAPSNLLEYVKYLNISSPPRFQKFVQSKGLTPLTLRFGPKMSNEMREDFPKESLPTVFDQAGVHSNFIVNFYQEITSFAIVIGAVVLLTVISAICENRNWETAKIFFDKLTIILKWNYIFVLISTSILKVIIYVALQFKTADSDSSFSGISIELCLIAMSFSLITVIASYWLILKQQAVRQEGPPHKISEFFVAWQGYQVLYRGFKDVSWSTSYFYIFYLLRIILVGLIASLLYMTPAFQTAAYLILSISMLAYIAKTKPLIRKVNLIQLIIFESLVLMVNVSLFALVLLQRNGKGDSSTAVMFGDIAIAGISTTNILALAMLAVKLFYGAIAIYKSSSSKQRRDPSTWLPLLVYGLQQGGMGFEEVSLNPGIETETRSELGASIQESQATKRGAKLKLSHVYPGDDNTNLLATKGQSPALELNVSSGSGENLSPIKTIQRTSIFSHNDSPLFKPEEASKKSKFTFLNME